MAHIRSDTHDFHLPLPTAIYDALRALAEQRRQPPVQVARTAIEDWLRQQEALSLHDAIAEYVAACAGSADDLDEDLEAAGLEQLRSIP
jgi:predicted transcriptional regulator